MKISKEELAELMGELSEILESADAYLKAGEKVVESLRPTVGKALKILLKALNETHKDLMPELEVNSLLGAKAKRRDFTNYVEVGLSKDQAFKLVLASIKPLNFTEALTVINSSRSKSEEN